MRYTSHAGTPDGTLSASASCSSTPARRVAATATAVRTFLARFLADPRVVELPRALWLPMLYGVILPLRPGRVGAQVRAHLDGGRLADERAVRAAAHRS